MKKIITILCLTMITSLSAQILPVEQLNEVTGEVHEQIEGIKYVKDVNNVLNKFEGTWKATFVGGEIEIIIKKYTRNLSQFVQNYHPEPLLWDELIGKYKIKKNGVVIENTLNLPDDSLEFLTKHRFYDTNTYTFSYLGVNHECGDNGYLILWYQNSNTIHLKYSYRGETNPECTSQAERTLPINTTLTLIKQ